jgi:hypothetical protein
MQAEKRSRRRGCGHAVCPLTRCRREFSLRCLAIAFGAKQVRTRELKEPGQFTCSQCGFYIVIPKANWSLSRRGFPRNRKEPQGNECVIPNVLIECRLVPGSQLVRSFSKSAVVNRIREVIWPVTF